MIFQALLTLEQQHQAGALCTVVDSRGSTPRRSGAKMLVYPNGEILGTVGGGELENRVIAEALAALKDGQARLLKYAMTDPARGDVGTCGGQVEVFVDPILPKPLLVVIGAGHVGKAVAHLAGWLGFRVAVSDDRPGMCTPEAFPQADMYLPTSMAELPQQLEITPWTYLVLTTRGSNVDAAGLAPLLETPFAYLGVIGSRRRWASTRQALLEQGVAQEKIQRVHSPIGLELNAETPEEIAVSILAEIILLRQGSSLKGGGGQPMSTYSCSGE